jgi:hypothetical protein
MVIDFRLGGLCGIQSGMDRLECSFGLKNS